MLFLPSPIHVLSVSPQVLVTLDHLERVSTFQDFVHIFSQFGNEMVEFAHLTGDRQNVSKDNEGLWRIRDECHR